MKIKCNPLKKGTQYLQLATDKFCFKDTLKFTAPCDYAKFVKVWNAPDGKSIWPYSYYDSVEDIKQARKFPPYSAFISQLNPKKSPTMQDYIASKREFYRRKLLPKGDPDRLCTMLGWLRFYNIQDVVPLAIAIGNCFSSYEKYFKVNPLLSASLPSLAQKATFLNYRKTDPLVFSFSKINEDIHSIFRNNVLGGVVNVYKRHVSTFDRPDIPFAARHAPNGDKYTCITMLDFTSMYLSCQQKVMPTTPGISWEMQTDGVFKKKIMTTGHSFLAQQWLVYKQETDPFLLNADGTRSVIQTAYNRGEHKIPRKYQKYKFWQVDGFAVTDHGAKIYEFNGDRWHKGCPHCAPWEPLDFIWQQKIKEVAQCGEVEVMWECRFKTLLETIRNMETPTFPDILKNRQTESDLLAAIINNKVYGFIVADIESDEKIVERYHDFPPVVKRFTVTEEHVLPWMHDLIKEKYGKAGFERVTLVQCFNAKQHLLMTNVAQYYIQKGLVIKNITKFVQYLPINALEPFAAHVTKMRIAAELEKNPTKSATSKMFGNSGFGKHGEKVVNHTKAVLTNCPKRIKKLFESPFFKTLDFLECENEEGVTEIIMKHRTIRDDKPVHIAISILQHSKLMMLKFVDFLKDFLIDGSYSLVYSGMV